jgi:polyphenol oxidase
VNHNKGFILKHSGRLAYLQAPLLEADELTKHAFSARTGGCSTGVVESLNTAFHTEDYADRVLENRFRFFRIFDIDHLQIVSAIQVHGTNLEEFGIQNRGEGAKPGSMKKRCDALVTTEPGVTLTAYAADCQLLYFKAMDRPLIGLAHAGKAGALRGIGPKVISYLKRCYNISPERLLVGMSPAICRNCYRINKLEMELFSREGWAESPYLEAAGNETWKLDLTAINKTQLMASGVRDEHIATNQWCTACRRDLFYSYRRDQGKTGRMIGFIVMNGEEKGES